MILHLKKGIQEEKTRQDKKYPKINLKAATHKGICILFFSQASFLSSAPSSQVLISRKERMEQTNTNSDCIRLHGRTFVVVVDLSVLASFQKIWHRQPEWQQHKVTIENELHVKHLVIIIVSHRTCVMCIKRFEVQREEECSLSSLCVCVPFASKKRNLLYSAFKMKKCCIQWMHYTIIIS